MSRPARAPKLLAWWVRSLGAFVIVARWLAHPEEPLEAMRLAIDALELEERAAAGEISADELALRLEWTRGRIRILNEQWWAYPLVLPKREVMEANLRRFERETTPLLARRAELLELKAARQGVGGGRG